MDHRLHTPICDMLGCTYPILQAGMGGVARAELAAAVSTAGGFGCLGMVRESAELIQREIAEVRRQTDRPFAVNLIPAATEVDLFRQELNACLSEKVETLIFFWDVVPDAVKRAKDAGCNVLYQVGSVDEARKAEVAGADAIIAQGVEAGGHVHDMVSSLVLLPQVAQAVSIPVVGSGGFASGASLAAALALGAQAIHCGTLFAATHESFAHSIHKESIKKAQSTDTIHTDAFAIHWPDGSPVRVLKTDTTKRIGQHMFGHRGEEISRERVAEEEGRPIYLFSTDSPLQSMTGDLEKLAMYAGQIVGEIDEVRSVESVIERIVSDAIKTLDRIGEPKRVLP